jgi:hypothetical protein
MEEDIQRHINQIWQVDRQSIDPNITGMAAFGTERFDAQRDYYKSLSHEEKSKYEDAVIAHCSVKELRKAKLGIYICSQLADVFPAEWKDRVTALVYSLIDIGLPIARESNAITYDLFILIRDFQIKPLAPWVREYFHQVSAAFKSGNIERIDWSSLFYGIFIALISISPEDFWEEFNLFHQDRNLIKKLGEILFEIIGFWISEGTRLYGLAWLRQLITEYSKVPDLTIKYDKKYIRHLSTEYLKTSEPTLRAIAYAVIKEYVKYLAGAGGMMSEEELSKFSEYLEEHLGS